MRGADKDIEEVSEALDAMVFQRAFTEDGYPLEGKSTTLNRALAWPRDVFLEALQFSMVRPERVHDLVRHLKELGVVAGPYQTSRMVGGKKVTLYLMTISLRALLKYVEAGYED